MSNIEYAKIIRWYAPKTIDVTGMKTTMTLPSSGGTQIVGNKGNGFINFYLAADGTAANGVITHIESGLSTNYEKQGSKWHWFYTGGGGGGGLYDINPGSTISLELSINAAKTGFNFIVNGVTRGTFPVAGITKLTNVRLVVGACGNKYQRYAADGITIIPEPETVPNPLPAWDTLHYQVTCSNIQYRNATGTWVTCTSTNSHPPTTGLYNKDTNPYGEVHWPIQNGVVFPHQGTPMYYTTNVSSGLLQASLKKF